MREGAGSLLMSWLQLLLMINTGLRLLMGRDVLLGWLMCWLRSCLMLLWGQTSEDHQSSLDGTQLVRDRGRVGMWLPKPLLLVN